MQETIKNLESENPATKPTTHSEDQLHTENKSLKAKLQQLLAKARAMQEKNKSLKQQLQSNAVVSSSNEGCVLLISIFPSVFILYRIYYQYLPASRLAEPRISALECRLEQALAEGVVAKVIKHLWSYWSGLPVLPTLLTTYGCSFTNAERYGVAATNRNSAQGPSAA